MEPKKRENKMERTCCSRYGCSRKFNKNDNIRFHSFPLKDQQLLKKWVTAMRRDDFQLYAIATLKNMWAAFPTD